jgi:hypothetical protein
MEAINITISLKDVHLLGSCETTGVRKNSETWSIIMG